MGLISRQDAIALGLKRYFTGVPCKYGHVSERYVLKSTCIECERSPKRKSYLAKHNKKYGQDPKYLERKRKYMLDRYRSNEDVRKRAVQYILDRLANDPFFKLKMRTRRLIGDAIRRNGYTKQSRTHEILGCDWPTFKRHIELQFPKGMTWENRDKWHIDHIVPVSSANSENELIALNHFTNLRPLWATENLSKSNQATHLI